MNLGEVGTIVRKKRDKTNSSSTSKVAGSAKSSRSDITHFVSRLELLLPWNSATECHIKGTKYPIRARNRQRLPGKKRSNTMRTLRNWGNWFVIIVAWFSRKNRACPSGTAILFRRQETHDRTWTKWITAGTLSQLAHRVRRTLRRERTRRVGRFEDRSLDR